MALHNNETWEVRQMLVCCGRLESGSGFTSGEGSIPSASACCSLEVTQMLVCCIRLENGPGSYPARVQFPRLPLEIVPL